MNSQNNYVNFIGHKWLLFDFMEEFQYINDSDSDTISEEEAIEDS